MNLWKKSALAVLAFSYTAASAFAQSVTVEGIGTDRDSAIRDAKRLAVEQVVGTFVDSRTLTANAMVVLDEIYTHAQGYVKDIRILEERGTNDFYRMRATVEVDESPNSALMNRLSTIMSLNNPRISVIVLNDLSRRSYRERRDYDETRNGHDMFTETALNKRLLELGFNHVVDAGLVSSLQDSQLLHNLYNGSSRLTGTDSNRPLDFLVLGKIRSNAYRISVPNASGRLTETQLYSGRADLTVKVLDYSTGTLVATFAVDGQGADNSEELAQNKAGRVAAQKAAEELDRKFRQLGARVSQGIRIVVRTSSPTGIDRLMSALRNIRGVDAVYLRERQSNSAVIEITSAQKPQSIYQSLLQTEELSLALENLNASELSLYIH